MLGTDLLLHRISQSLLKLLRHVRVDLVFQLFDTIRRFMTDARPLKQRHCKDIDPYRGGETAPWFSLWQPTPCAQPSVDCGAALCGCSQQKGLHVIAPPPLAIVKSLARTNVGGSSCASSSCSSPVFQPAQARTLRQPCMDVRGVTNDRNLYRHFDGTPLVVDAYMTFAQATLSSNTEGPGCLAGLASPYGLTAEPGYLTPETESLGPTEARGVHVSLWPMSANEVDRYGREVREEHAVDHCIPRLTLEYPNHESETPIPSGWKLCIHPQGSPYYFNPETRTLTDVDICLGGVHEDILWYSHHLWRMLMDALESTAESTVILNECQLVIEPKIGREGQVIGCYYFVNTRTRCIFWLSDHDASSILEGCAGVARMSHKKHAIAAQFWKHCELFPEALTIDCNTLDEAMNVLLHAHCDRISSGPSLTKIGSDTMDVYLSILGNLKVLGRSSQSSHVTSTVGRIMYTITSDHFLNHYGQQEARRCSSHASSGWHYEQSLGMALGSWLLFRAPNTYYVRYLHKIFADGISSKQTWNTFSARINSELQEFNLLATVLLNANVGFLAIQSVDNGGGRSMTQIASYWSLIASIGSIVLGTFLVRYHQALNHVDDEMTSRAAKFLSRMSAEKHGLEKLAVIYSLPYALLMWGIVLFLGAFSIEWCQPGDIRSRSANAVFLGITFVIVMWGICVTHLAAADDSDYLTRLCLRLARVCSLRGGFKSAVKSELNIRFSWPTTAADRAVDNGRSV
ncbi:hypothetical protein CONPUDRAFT_145764 [Coniophora puteana RWD-64-598 SS2]|uniref:WW domain-containing protein n=1 Tax=Coniophora puteana (strain RWD-64-598) TaxID=741705 RepID=A0A5M3MHR8_CONPW|nr:uncharacterized protein CONPUDRAFT_145764 [Coniophora puteana RWD-64-598 SS2]EIW78597.1 hypothetical protein CONPUDRAFT_145764 [Coniophora puteana RWD-64-598 SS2]